MHSPKKTVGEFPIALGTVGFAANEKARLAASYHLPSEPLGVAANIR